ncbi:hypothetical protein BJ741DRAFT_609336 [Chytriomyces cf. hyalinus JEL632]|nr:hypothetical protein BJ741DRAFT_609336 [Chytriomyces cf. hyalinus JEL632]
MRATVDSDQLLPARHWLHAQTSHFRVPQQPAPPPSLFPLPPQMFLFPLLPLLQCLPKLQCHLPNLPLLLQLLSLLPLTSLSPLFQLPPPLPSLSQPPTPMLRHSLTPSTVSGPMSQIAPRLVSLPPVSLTRLTTCKLQTLVRPRKPRPP